MMSWLYRYSEVSALIMRRALLNMPLMDYADFVYDGLPQYNAMTLQKLQNCAFRRILQAPRMTPSAYMHEQLNMDQLGKRRFKHVCVMVYKILNGLAPKTLTLLFKYVTNVSERTTRQAVNKLLYIEKPRLEMTKRSFRYRAAVCWNSLPVHIREAPSLDTFKSALCNYLDLTR